MNVAELITFHYFFCNIGIIYVLEAILYINI